MTLRGCRTVGRRSHAATRAGEGLISVPGRPRAEDPGISAHPYLTPGVEGDIMRNYVQDRKGGRLRFTSYKVGSRPDWNSLGAAD